MYDPATDLWTIKTPMPTARVYPAASIINNKIYITGGFRYMTTHEEYDPTTDSWIVKEPMPTGRCPDAVSVNNVIYAIGGCSGASMATNEAYSLDMTTIPVSATFYIHRKD
jgi:N-acetylneuraminic acid mutarotase